MGISKNGIKSISEEDLVRNARKHEILKCQKKKFQNPRKRNEYGS